MGAKLLLADRRRCGLHPVLGVGDGRERRGADRRQPGWADPLGDRRGDRPPAILPACELGRGGGQEGSDGGLQRPGALDEGGGELLRAFEGGQRRPAVRADLHAKPWDLDGAEQQVLTGGVPGSGGGELVRLQRIAACRAPSAPAVAETAAALASAAQAATAVAGTESARALEWAELLDRALAFHRQHAAADCPVCETPGAFGPAWERRSADEVRRLRAEAHFAGCRRAGMKNARSAALALLAPAPPALANAAGLGLYAEVSSAVRQARARASQLASSPRSGFSASEASLRALSRESRARRSNSWAPTRSSSPSTVLRASYSRDGPSSSIEPSSL